VYVELCMCVVVYVYVFECVCECGVVYMCVGRVCV